MKIGLSVRIDVTKIEKARLYAGAKGTYLDLTTSVDKEEREQGVKTPILGNVKVFFSGETERVQQQTNSEWTDEYKANSTKIDEDIPF